MGKFPKKKSESLLTEHPARLKEFILAEETTRIFIKKDLSLEKEFSPKFLMQLIMMLKIQSSLTFLTLQKLVILVC